jgi:hypothetical protein
MANNNQIPKNIHRVNGQTDNTSKITKEKVLLENPENNRERMDYYRSINRKFVIFDLLCRVWIFIR